MTITLAQLEQEAGRRVGPFVEAWQDRQVPSTANFDFAVCPSLRSNIDIDSVTNLWLLRRGIDYLGNPLPVSLDVYDRQRMVSAYDPEQGRVFVDHQWQTIPLPGEAFEFHHLDPEQQLRVAVNAGLRRCFTEDMLQVQPTASYGGGVDLTSQLPWVTSGDQVTGVRYGWLYPYLDVPFNTYMQSGHVILGGCTYQYLPQWLWISVLRPAWSWVNGADSSTGPVDDDDVLEVDLDYAAAAAHIEAWHYFPARLQAAAAGGLQATQQMAAAEFQRQVSFWGPSRPRRFGFSSGVWSW